MSRHRQIVENIRALVREQGLGPGERLPSERALAERFGASRGGVREALRALAEQGAVQSRHGDGTYLLDRKTLVEGPARALSAQHARLHARLRHVFDFRRMFEPAIARMAAENLTPRDLERLKVLTLDQQRALAEPDSNGRLVRAAELDAEFHMQLARATGNPVVLEVLRAAAGLLGETRTTPLQTPERRQDSLKGHLDIICALERRDPEGAERAMRTHLAAAQRDALARSGPTKNEKDTPEPS